MESSTLYWNFDEVVLYQFWAISAIFDDAWLLDTYYIAFDGTLIGSEEERLYRC